MPRKKKPSFEPEPMVPMYSFDTPESSAIAYGDYDPGQRLLRVHIKQKAGGVKRYLHGGVPPELWEEFLAAPSKGQFYNMAIRPLYAGRLDAE